MIKVSDVIRESVNYINDTEHFRVDMEVVDSLLKRNIPLFIRNILYKFERRKGEDK
ncbi:MAG: hypothetical protein ACRCW0_05180 [Clostridium sp.]